MTYGDAFGRYVYTEDHDKPYHEISFKNFLFLVFNGVDIDEIDQHGDNSLDSLIYWLTDLSTPSVQKHVEEDPLCLFLQDHSQSFGYKKFTTEELPMQELQDKILEGKLPIDFPVEHCNSSLLNYAAAGNDTDLMKRLLQKGADVNQSNYLGFTPLLQAFFPRVSIFNKDTYVNRHIPPGFSDFRFSFTTPEEFYDLSEDEQEKHYWFTNEGWSWVNKSLIQILLEAGSNPNHVSNQGATPLLMAMDLGNRELVEMLIEYGAEPNYVDKWGLSIFDSNVYYMKERPLRYRQTYAEIACRFGTQRLFDYIHNPDLPRDEELEMAQEELLTSNTYSLEDVEYFKSLFPSTSQEEVNQKMYPDRGSFEAYYDKVETKYARYL